MVASCWLSIIIILTTQGNMKVKICYFYLASCCGKGQFRLFLYGFCIWEMLLKKTENLLPDAIQMHREFLYRVLEIYWLLFVAPGLYAQPSHCAVEPEARVKCHRRFNDLAKHIRPRKHGMCEVLIAVRWGVSVAYPSTNKRLCEPSTAKYWDKSLTIFWMLLEEFYWP